MRLKRTHKRPVVSVYVRHRDTCPKAFIRDERGVLKKNEFYAGCDCTKWVRFSLKGKQHKQATGERSWRAALEKAAELQRRLDRGEGQEIPRELPDSKKQESIRDLLNSYVLARQSQGAKRPHVRKLKYQLKLFEDFLARRGKFTPREITPTDVIEFRASWPWADITRMRAQSILRSFLRFAIPENFQLLSNALGTIKETKESKERRSPKPLSEKQITALLEQIPTTFAGKPRKICFFQTLVRTLISTGLAIVDAVQLSRADLERADETGVLQIKRQKTGKTAMIPVDRAWLDELLTSVKLDELLTPVKLGRATREINNDRMAKLRAQGETWRTIADHLKVSKSTLARHRKKSHSGQTPVRGNPEYVFWDGKSLADSKTKRLNEDMVKVMQDANLYTRGNVFHRFRDTAVDFWLGQGWSLTDVAVALGDTLVVVEQHYKDWTSQRQRERVANLPTRNWKTTH